MIDGQHACHDRKCPHRFNCDRYVNWKSGAIGKYEYIQSYPGCFILVDNGSNSAEDGL